MTERKTLPHYAYAYDPDRARLDARSQKLALVYDYLGISMTRQQGAALAGVSIDTFSRRMQAGMTFREAVAKGKGLTKSAWRKKDWKEKPPRALSYATTRYDYENEPLTVFDGAKLAGISPKSFRLRLKRMSFAQAVETPRFGKPR